MKKLVYLLAVSFGASMFAACGNSDKAAEAADTVAVEEVAIEEVAAPADSAAAVADSAAVVADSAAVVK
ncbi:MAG TPA: hypothetical protein K8V47_03435 [Candidatus Amulumruptor caecigallinarius]|uniref:Lipoprotein n=1 Tax=Candidatus Amulumruptor caecigallinarius TaxID=2109911 RepID=A0A921JHU7_9BACT|nr:hypothetical protein [Candidatus Amulumruptor caecigallinarius]